MGRENRGEGISTRMEGVANGEGQTERRKTRRELLEKDCFVWFFAALV